MERPNTPEPTEHLQIVVQYPDGSTETQRVIPEDAKDPGPLRPESDWNTEIGRAAKQSMFDQYVSGVRMPTGQSTRLRWFTQVVRTVTEDPIRIREIEASEPEIDEGAPGNPQERSAPDPHRQTRPASRLPREERY